MAEPEIWTHDDYTIEVFWRDGLIIVENPNIDVRWWEAFDRDNAIALRDALSRAIDGEG